MVEVNIRKPVFYNRTISIRRDLIERACRNFEMLHIRIEAKPYNEFEYVIDPFRALAVGREWWVKGVKLINFPIAEMAVC